MLAKDVMTTRVVTVSPDAPVREIAELLRDNRVSAVPVVDVDGAPLGIVSEGDLLRRPELGTLRRPSWWLDLLAEPREKALDYIKSHGGNAKDVMTRQLVTVLEDASLEEVADTLETHRIKRVLVLRDGRLIGVVSRADLLHGLVARQSAPEASDDDRSLARSVESELGEAGVQREYVNVVMSGGVVHLWGAVESDAERRAAEMAARNVAGVVAVRNQLGVLPASVRAAMWAE